MRMSRAPKMPWSGLSQAIGEKGEEPIFCWISFLPFYKSGLAYWREKMVLLDGNDWVWAFALNG